MPADPCYSFDIFSIADPHVREAIDKLATHLNLVLGPWVNQQITEVGDVLIHGGDVFDVTNAVPASGRSGATPGISLAGSEIRGDNVHIQRVGNEMRHINVATGVKQTLAVENAVPYNDQYVCDTEVDDPLHLHLVAKAKPNFWAEIADAGAHADERYDVVEQEPDGAGDWQDKVAGPIRATAYNEAERAAGTHLLPDGEIVLVVRRWDAALNAWHYSFRRSLGPPPAWQNFASSAYVESAAGHTIDGIGHQHTAAGLDYYQHGYYAFNVDGAGNSILLPEDAGNQISIRIPWDIRAHSGVAASSQVVILFYIGVVEQVFNPATVVYGAPPAIFEAVTLLTLDSWVAVGEPSIVGGGLQGYYMHVNLSTDLGGNSISYGIRLRGVMTVFPGGEDSWGRVHQLGLAPPAFQWLQHN